MPRFFSLSWEVRTELKEISFGSFGGLHKKEIPFDFHVERSQDIWNTTWPKGESYKDVNDRILGLASEIKSLNGKVAVFAHETVNRVLIGELAGWDKQKILALKHPHNVVYRLDKNGVSTKIHSDIWLSNMFFLKLNDE